MESEHVENSLHEHGPKSFDNDLEPFKCTRILATEGRELWLQQ